MIRNLWRNLFHRRALEADIDAEVRAMQDLLEDESPRRPVQRAGCAARRAILTLGRPGDAQKRIRDVGAGRVA